jgi:hypothetical protein
MVAFPLRDDQAGQMPMAPTTTGQQGNNVRLLDGGSQSRSKSDFNTLKPINPRLMGMKTCSGLK